MTDEEHISAICLAMYKPTATQLNALHACRPGHPLGQNDNYKFRNAKLMAHCVQYVDRPHVSLKWLEKMAKREFEESGD